MGDLVLYKEQQLERIKGQELIKPELLLQALPRFFLAGNVYVGRYNQAGFVVVDRTPDERPFWIGSDRLRYHPRMVEEGIKHGSIPEEKRYFYDTRGGMAALRYFAISEELMEIFKKDKFLGEPLIRKICEDGIVPEYFEELPVFPPWGDAIGEYNLRIDFRNETDLGKLVNVLLAPLKERVGRDYEHFPYVTYLPTAAYSLIVPTLEESVQEVVARFDQFGDKFRLRESYPELKINPLMLKE